MGSLLSGVSFKEPTTVEDCDSTWETDSEPEPELQDPGGEEEGPPLEQAGGGSDSDDPAADRQRRRQQQQQQQPEEPLPAAGGRPEAAEKRERAAEEEEEEQVVAVDKEEEKEGGDGVAEEDETEGREQGESEAPVPEQVTRDPLQTSAGEVGGLRGARWSSSLAAFWTGPSALTLAALCSLPRLSIAFLERAVRMEARGSQGYESDPEPFLAPFHLRPLLFPLHCLPPQPF